MMLKSIMITVLCGFILIGCSKEKASSTPPQPRVSPGSPKHYDVGDQMLKRKLPEDMADGFLELNTAPGFSYGMLMAHENISSRSHERSDLLIYIHSGIARFHVAQESYFAAAGDVVYIPRGAIYSVTTREKKYPLEFLAFYSPPLNPDDIVYHDASEEKK